MSDLASRLEFLGVLALALLAGINIFGAVHELGHLVVATAFGAHVARFQPWQFLGHAQTVVSPLPDGQRALVALSGILASNGLVLALLVFLPWHRLSPRVAVAAAAAMAASFHQVWPFLVCALRTDLSDATVLAVSTGCGDLTITLTALALLAGLVWLWLRRTQVLSRWVEAWAEKEAAAV